MERLSKLLPKVRCAQLELDYAFRVARSAMAECYRLDPAFNEPSFAAETERIIVQPSDYLLRKPTLNLVPNFEISLPSSSN